jgi:hypothetical protein
MSDTTAYLSLQQEYSRTVLAITCTKAGKGTITNHINPGIKPIRI